MSKEKNLNRKKSQNNKKNKKGDDKMVLPETKLENMSPEQIRKTPEIKTRPCWLCQTNTIDRVNHGKYGVVCVRCLADLEKGKTIKQMQIKNNKFKIDTEYTSNPEL